MGCVSAPGGCLLWGVSAPRWDICSQGGVCSQGVSAPRGVSTPRGCLLWGCLLPGVSAPGGLPQTCPPVNRMTNRCKNITLATTSLQPVTTIHSSDFFRLTKFPEISSMIFSFFQYSLNVLVFSRAVVNSIAL